MNRGAEIIDPGELVGGEGVGERGERRSGKGGGWVREGRGETETQRTERELRGRRNERGRKRTERQRR